MGIYTFAVANLEQAINLFIELDPTARKEMAQLHGQAIGLELEGLDRILYLVPGQHRLQILTELEGEPDCILKGTPMALARMGDQRSTSKQIFSGDVKITGDTELAHRLGKILGTMDIDWEEQFSRFSGDIIAHAVGNGLRAANRWGRQSTLTLEMNLKEYLQEELRLLPVRIEIDGFIAGVDTLRDDTDRLSAKLERLHTRLAGDGLNPDNRRKTH